MSDVVELVGHLRRAFEKRNASPTAAPILVILGTSRPNGNTRKLVDAAFPPGAPARIVDLSDHRIAPYAYDYRHDADDFLTLARAMIEAKTIVFATPVYWYAMSAQLKVFFDRLSDLTRVYKKMGRSLAGKNVYAIATSSGDGLPAGFETPFAQTSRYLDMRWKGLLHAHFSEDGVLTPEMARAAKAFAEKVEAGLGGEADAKAPAVTPITAACLSAS